METKSAKFNMYIEPSTLRKLDDLCEKRECSRAEMIRSLIKGQHAMERTVFNR